MKKSLLTIVSALIFTFAAYAGGAGCSSCSAGTVASDKKDSLTKVAYADNSADKAKEKAAKKQYDLYVVKVHADWCTTCTKTEGAMAQLANEHSKSDVKFMTIDLTNDETAAKSYKIAKKYGVKDAVKNYRSTGMVLILDGKTHKPLEVMTGVKSFADYNKAVEKHMPERVALAD